VRSDTYTYQQGTSILLLRPHRVDCLLLSLISSSGSIALSSRSITSHSLIGGGSISSSGSSSSGLETGLILGLSILEETLEDIVELGVAAGTTLEGLCEARVFGSVDTSTTEEIRELVLIDVLLELGFAHELDAGLGDLIEPGRDDGPDSLWTE